MSKAEEAGARLAECAERRDFEGAFAVAKECGAELAGALGAAGLRDALKKATADRVLQSFLDGAGFGERPLDKAFVAFEKLAGFQPGTFVLCDAWGLGTVKRIDCFYRKITVDFRTRRGHQFSYAAAADMLSRAPEDHVLVQREADPEAFAALLAEKPGEVVKAVLKSYGDMPVVRLEDVCTVNGFVKSANWKKFWDTARAQLRSDPLVEIPARRADPIRLKASAEDYGDAWMTAFSHETDPRLILAAVREYAAQGRFKKADAETRAKFEERLSFAATAARKVDDALYARIATETTALGLERPSAAEMRMYMRERKRYVKAAAALPARETGALIAFLAESDAAKAELYETLPELCFAAVSEILSRFGSEAACREAVGALMRRPKAPATLTTILVGRYEAYADWKELPPAIVLLTHAIALGEGRQSGETLKMQNIVRRLFADPKWLEKTFAALGDDDKALFFERFQASIAWDPSTHHAIAVRMVRIEPSLASRVAKGEKKKTYARLTSRRSFAAKKAEYAKLINEEMPANVKRIEFAKSYGDLSENAEYQYAKDEQRALLQKQSLMQADLEAVKPDDFASVPSDEVAPGVSVAIETPDGEKTYHILGEWDNDPELGILSSKAQLAANMLGLRPGDTFDLPGADGAAAKAKVLRISPLPETVREWMKAPADA